MYDKKNPSVTLLKKRYTLQSKYPKLKFGESGIALKCNLRFEFIYLFYMRKFLKRSLKKKKMFKKLTKVWVFIRPNHVLTKKSKNSRMGKGKGSFVRWCTLLHKGFIFIEFRNISVVRLQKYLKKLEKKMKIPLHLIYKYNNIKIKRKQFIGSNDTSLVTPFIR